MVGRTHDLAAFTFLNIAILTLPLPHITLSTAFVALGANMIGGIFPDADQPTGALWSKIPAGTIFGKIAHPFIGAHRHLSHSLLGMFLFGWLLSLFLTKLHNVLLVDMNIVWWAFMIGYFSHLIMDSLTTEGVPWLLPIPAKFGFPPFSFLRIPTGGFREKFIVFPALLILNGYLFYAHYHHYLIFLKSLLTKQ